MRDYQVEVRGFWHGLGVDQETGFPVHLPMPTNENGDGPQEERLAVGYACWCGRECPLHVELQKAVKAGARSVGGPGSKP